MWIVAMAMMMGVTMGAQEHGRKHHGEDRPAKEQRDPFTPEQHAELRAKKLTLSLDLTDKQQAELQNELQQWKKFYGEWVAEMNRTYFRRQAQGWGSTIRQPKGVPDGVWPRRPR